MLNIELIIYPTDTVYGIGVDATNPEAFKEINKIKKTDIEKPISIMFHDLKQVEEFIQLSEEYKKIIEKNLIKSFTFLIPNQLKKPLYFGTSDKIGIRIANTKITKLLTEEHPILSTSANISGNKAPISIDEIPEEIISKCKVINGGTLPGIASTVIDLKNKKIVRQGPSEPIW